VSDSPAVLMAWLRAHPAPPGLVAEADDAGTRVTVRRAKPPPALDLDDERVLPVAQSPPLAPARLRARRFVRTASLMMMPIIGLVTVVSDAIAHPIAAAIVVTASGVGITWKAAREPTVTEPVALIVDHAQARVMRRGVASVAIRLADVVAIYAFEAGAKVELRVTPRTRAKRPITIWCGTAAACDWIKALVRAATDG